MAKCYVKAYFDWIEQTAALSDAEKGRLFISILEYARSGLLPDGNGREGILFPAFKAAIDRDNEISAQNSANGSKGGRGNKANESEQKRNKANESEQKPTKTKTKTQDYDKDKEIRESDALTRRAYGEYGWVKLSDAEYSRLLAELGGAELDRCIAYVDESAQSTGNKNRWKDWNLTVRKCHRDGWGVNRKGVQGASTADRLARMIEEGVFGD